MRICTLLYVSLLLDISIVRSFVPHPVIRFGGQAGESLTHTEITQLGFIRSLARFFLEVEDQARINGATAKSLQDQHTIDELYQLVHPTWTDVQVKVHSFPLKSVIDRIQVHNALVDLDSHTKNLPSAHFDAETFVAANRRVMDLRRQVIENTRGTEKQLDKARASLGALLHTLQDFYSHSNWIEMGKTYINEKIGLQEDIGRIASPNQATCTSDGCSKIQEKCNFLQRFILKSCPMEYYDCRNNIRPEINLQGLLTSGYVAEQFDENRVPVTKPNNVEKCSHGSILDASSHSKPIGGINKDTMVPTYSPHFHLHFDAAKMAVEATERFFEDLRKDLGNEQYDRLFSINPTREQLIIAEQEIRERKQFHFLSSTLSIGLSSSDLSFQRTMKQRLEMVMSWLFDITGSSDQPTLDIKGVEITTDNANIHSGSMIVRTLKRRTHKKRKFSFV